MMAIMEGPPLQSTRHIRFLTTLLTSHTKTALSPDHPPSLTITQQTLLSKCKHMHLHARSMERIMCAAHAHLLDIRDRDAMRAEEDLCFLGRVKFLQLLLYELCHCPEVALPEIPAPSEYIQLS